MLVTGLLSYFVLPPIYKGSALIQPAQIGSNLLLTTSETDNLTSWTESRDNSSNLLLTPSEIQAQIESDYFIQKLSNDLNVSFKEINSGINVSIPTNTNFVLVEFESKDKELVKRFFDKLLPEINDLNKGAYDKQIDLIKSKISTLSKQLESLNTKETQIFQIMQQLERGGAVNLVIDLPDSIIIRKQEVEEKIIDLDSQLKMSHEYLYFYQPSILDTPIKPNKKLNVAIAGVAALFFSILLAFFLEYWKGSQDSHNKEVKA
jgi:capsular polysaccharide biosynthesis protein